MFLILVYYTLQMYLKAQNALALGVKVKLSIFYDVQMMELDPLHLKIRQKPDSVFHLAAAFPGQSKDDYAGDDDGQANA